MLSVITVLDVIKLCSALLRVSSTECILQSFSVLHFISLLLGHLTLIVVKRSLGIGLEEFLQCQVISLEMLQVWLGLKAWQWHMRLISQH